MVELDRHFDMARAEVDGVQPQWSPEDQMYLVEHPAYPMVMHADPDPEKALTGYFRALRQFVKYRLAGEIADTTEQATSGRGGAREGAGRPRKNETKTVRLPVDMADWLRDQKHQDQVRRLMQG
ncbi:MAG: hypothetical protein IPK79_10845 [Vampirovibrionales bacterium]|nr:hypothetical protein [Vampirovibrionales bacterium]